MGKAKNHLQKFHFKAILGNIGLLLHIPAIMALLSIFIALIFKEFYAIPPLVLTGILGLGVGHLLYCLFYNPSVIRLWDAMMTAAISLIVSCFLVVLPLYLTPSNSPLGTFVDALFEAVSGFTSTGLTMVEKPSILPHTLQWWRSFLQWVGGIGLIVFIISIVKTQKEEYSLYYAEKRRYRFHHNLRTTSRLIWTIYSIYTLLSTLLLMLGGMPLWDALNHSMTGLATGGFSTSDTSIAGYPIQAQWATILVMIIGATSFRVHFAIMREGQFSALWTNKESRLMIYIFAIGTALIALLNLWTLHESRLFDSFFQCVSAMGTCGFFTTSMTSFAPIVRLVFIVGMIIGGPSDATTGGINLHRFQNLLENLALPFTIFSRKRERKALKQLNKEETTQSEPPTDILQSYTERKRRLHSAAVICILWLFVLVLGWFFLLIWVPEAKSLDALFDAASAMSNIGLSTGITTPALSLGGKVVMMLLMILGRLDIIPILICFLALYLGIKRRFKNGKRASR